MNIAGLPLAKNWARGSDNSLCSGMFNDSALLKIEKRVMGLGIGDICKALFYIDLT